MIASVRGEVLVRRPDHVVLDSAGVGYRLAVSGHTLRSIPAAGSEAFLHAHLVLRDDGMNLYGFATEEERDLFLSLLSVSSVGPRIAMAVLSGASPREHVRAIAAGDAGWFQSYSGVGKKMAERIIVDLRDKVVEAGESTDASTAAVEDDPLVLAREGLIGLGYTPEEARMRLSGVEGETPEELIAAALKAGAR